VAQGLNVHTESIWMTVKEMVESDPRSISDVPFFLIYTFTIMDLDGVPIESKSTLKSFIIGS